jgi:alpha-beta hydrolase superfamily lysophospholipase
MSFGALRLKDRPRLKRGIVVLTVLLASWLLVCSAVTYRLTRRAGVRTAEPLPRITWGQIEPERIKTSDGEELGAWFVDGLEKAPSVLLLHGNNGNRSHTLSRGQLLASRGWAVLMVTLRAHGDSTGDYHDIGWGARRDVWAAVEYLEKRRPGRPLIVSGNSMGSAAAVFAAKELGHRVQGYILESPYRDLKVAVWNRLDNSLPRGFSHIAYAGLRTVGPLFLPHIEQVSPLKAISGIPEDVPVLILAGDADRHARLDEAQALFGEVATHGKLVVFPGAGHGNLFNSNRDLYERTVLEFCREISELTRLSSAKPVSSGKE